ncbi:sulfite exporter TauE/SafE family protein [Cognatishimia sp. MH4019]|uniref:sulfite exporter TauE/SafE family protein n=1 Tax=Cognatishimia sp. MH4019 TaxID=2854030 RepID=UPI001CD58317|nr:sulfite exporter TauE/SafE family protein [Cognatishimia sp. MH4019]
MDSIFALMSPTLLIAALGIAFLGGVVKGVVGFAMPMVVISGLSGFLPPDVALAGLILPTLVANGGQALRQGIGAAIRSIRSVWRFLLFGLVTLLLSAQLVAVLPADLLFLMMGVPVVLFATFQLAGWRLHIAEHSRRVWEAGIGAFAGFIGGISGIWGPPTVAYLTAIETPKVDQMRVMGVIYGLGAVALTAAHVQSGVLNAQTAPFSAVMIAPAFAGMALGWLVHDKIDQQAFRKATLAVLFLAGLNLIRRGLF